MKVLEKDIGNVRVIVLSGALTAENADPLCAAVGRALPNPGRIILDLAEMRSIDQTGIGVLAMLLEQTKNNGRPLKLACLQILPRSVFNMIEVCPLFEMYDTLSAALDSFRD